MAAQQSSNTAGTARKLEKAEWHPLFGGLSKTLQTEVAEIEVAGLDIGDEVETDWLQLIGITYDQHDNIMDVALDGVDHIINKPREVYVETGSGGLIGLEI